MFLLRKSLSCLKTTFSRILLKNGRLDIGLKLPRTEPSSFPFLSSGFMMADFRAMGKMPVDREQFTISNTSSVKQSKTLLKNHVGIGSSEHVEDFICETTVLKVWGLIRSNESMTALGILNSFGSTKSNVEFSSDISDLIMEIFS